MTSQHVIMLVFILTHVCYGMRLRHEAVLRNLQRRSIDVHRHCGEEFPCLNSTQCVPQDAICDGTPDCDNGSDEWEKEECNDFHTNQLWDAMFGEKDDCDDSEEEDDDCDDDDSASYQNEAGNFLIEAPCENGTFPETCECIVELEKPSAAQRPVRFSTLPAESPTGPDDTSETPSYRSTSTTGTGTQSPVVEGTVIGVKIDCRASGLTSFPRNLPENTLFIDVSDNKITELAREDLANLTQLRILSLSRNKLRHIDDEVFNPLTELERLDMIACGLDEIPARFFASQSRLKFLKLAHNNLKTLARTSLIGLDSLVDLDVRGNQISDLEVGVFEHTPRLFTIHFSENRLSSIPASILRPLWNLNWISFQRNDISNIEKGAFSTNEMLTTLMLADNKLTAVTRGVFHNLTNLVLLTLRNNSIRRFEEGAFDGMTKLQTLKLTTNPFTSLPLRIFDRLTRLQKIYFDHFSLCGYAPHVRLCMPKSDGISTAENLLANHLLRFGVWFVALLASVGNAFVLFARCFVKEDKKTHSFFIMNLAVADLLMGLYLLIIGTHDVIFRGTYILHDLAWRTSVICKLGGFLSLLSSEVSIMTLAVITMDRFLSIVHPFRFKNRSLLHARLLMAFLWLLGIALGTLPLVHLTYFGDLYYGGNGVCLPLQIDQPFSNGWEFSLVIFVVFNLVAFMFISYAYLMMFVTIRKSNLAMRSTKKNQDWALVKRFTLIVATDLLCWMPIIVVKFIALGGVLVSQSVYAWFAIFVLPINSALNPILYTMTTVLFKQKVLAPLGIVRTQRKKGYITGTSVDETSSGLSKTSGTRLSIISTKSRGGSWNGRLSSHKKLRNSSECQDSTEESFNGSVGRSYSKKNNYQELPTSDPMLPKSPCRCVTDDDNAD
ncbi:uncharacterized protein [Asterias amurensis]|uniref:uncharacterized protein n=1 Tax=Asterias amurensis TaxID=7602 RepID=UPI003AB8AB5A